MTSSDALLCDTQWPGISHIRSICDSLIPGYNVLDCTTENILNYQFGFLHLIERDLNILSESLPSHFHELWTAYGISAAFKIRLELINYKKVSLHLMHRAQAFQLNLKRLSFYYFVTFAEVTVSPDIERYFDISKTLMACRGATLALEDMRAMTKSLCAIPRHPNGVIGRSLKRQKDLPLSLYSYAVVILPACEFLDSIAESQSWPQSWASKHIQPSFYLGLWQFFIDSLKSFNYHPDALFYITQAHIARGAAKVLNTWSHALRLSNALQQCLCLSSELIPELYRLGYGPNDWTNQTSGLVILARKHYHCVLGNNVVLSDFAKWISIITGAGDDKQMKYNEVTCVLSFIKDSSERLINSHLFFAPDSFDSAMFVPKEFEKVIPNVLKQFQIIDKKYTTLMCQELDSAGWPPSGSDKNFDGKEQCRQCLHKFSHLWINLSGCCYHCEKIIRKTSCPYSSQCKFLCFHNEDDSSSECCHCFVHDRWSCQTCNLTIGDGEEVVAMVASCRINLVFLDFDRTISSSKSGNSPLNGNHTVDADLYSLLTSHPNIHVVTRNSHTADIQTFLYNKNQVSKSVTIHKVDKHASKGAVLKTIIQNNECLTPMRALFADDTISEHFDSHVVDLANSGVLRRVLFSRVFST